MCHIKMALLIDLAINYFRMKIQNVLHQSLSGIVVGLSSIVYAVSHGALLFTGGAASYVAYGITAAIVTAVIYSLASIFTENKHFILGTDSSSVSVMVAVLSTLPIVNIQSSEVISYLMLLIFLTTLISSILFFVVFHYKLANLVRFVPFSVMAGLLASTGWLMCSGSLMIISGVSLSVQGVKALVNDWARPELVVGVLVVAFLFALAKKISSAFLLPLMIIIFTLASHLFLNDASCSLNSQYCDPLRWYFDVPKTIAWFPPWMISFSNFQFSILFNALPSMIVVAFVGVITLLLAVASLELSFRKEFNFNQVLKVHSIFGILSALLGGFVGIISTGRTALSKSTGGDIFSAVIATLLCLAMLLGGSRYFGLIPKAALGGIILYLGLSMLKQWIWDQRKVSSSSEMLEVISILVVVANFGYLAGFVSGIMLACLTYVISNSKNPLTKIRTDVSLYSSSVVRPYSQRKALEVIGKKSLIYKLTGYIFFGSAKNIDLIFDELEPANVENILLDFTDVIGIDKSSIGVFNKIFRRYESFDSKFHVVMGNKDKKIFHAMQLGLKPDMIFFYQQLDNAIESIEESLISALDYQATNVSCFDFLKNKTDQDSLVQYCELRSYVLGDTLCQEGDNSKEIFFLKNGTLEVVKASSHRPIRLSKLIQGGMVGEIAFYSGNKRSASILAASNSEVYVLTETAIELMRRNNPSLASHFDHSVINKLADALLKSNSLLASHH